jgi:hypothetical protein
MTSDLIREKKRKERKKEEKKKKKEKKNAKKEGNPLTWLNTFHPK